MSRVLIRLPAGMVLGGIPLNMWSECVLTAVYLINRLPSAVLSRKCPLPSAVLSGKCPYELVYKSQPNLSYLRDVKFYETVYPFKNDSLTKEYITEQSGINNLNFFDNQWPSEPYDDERDPNDGGGTNSSCVEPVMEAASTDPNSTADPSSSTSDSSPKSSNSKQKGTDSLGSIIAEGGVDDDGASLNDDEFISEGDSIDLYNVDMLFQENVNQDKTKDGQSIRRSSRKFVLPSKLKDFVVDRNVNKDKNKPVKLVDGDEKLLENVTGFQKRVGKLISLTLTRPDISYVMHKLSQVMHAPKLADMKSAFKVLRYIKSSPGNGIQYSKSNNFQVTAFVDSDWAKHRYVVSSLMDTAYWSSEYKRQSVLAKSSAEAEYKAMSSVTCKVIWILKVLTELKVEYKTPIELFCDNNSAIQIAANPVFHERTKHFEIDLFFLREKIAESVIKTVKIKSEDNVLDFSLKVYL
ncbi:hypothetical protein Tco_0582717 [Tanacetum coccineum]